MYDSNRMEFLGDKASFLLLYYSFVRFLVNISRDSSLQSKSTLWKISFLLLLFDGLDRLFVLGKCATHGSRFLTTKI